MSMCTSAYVLQQPGWTLQRSDPGRQKIRNSTLSSPILGFSFACLYSVLQLWFCRYWVQCPGRDCDGKSWGCVSTCVCVFLYICMSQGSSVLDRGDGINWSKISAHPLRRTAGHCGKGWVHWDWKDAYSFLRLSSEKWHLLTWYRGQIEKQRWIGVPSWDRSQNTDQSFLFLLFCYYQLFSLKAKGFHSPFCLNVRVRW